MQVKKASAVATWQTLMRPAFPELSKVAIPLLGAAATSSSSERGFSLTKTY
jgi:hypothetical protein